MSRLPVRFGLVMFAILSAAVMLWAPRRSRAAAAQPKAEATPAPRTEPLAVQWKMEPVKVLAYGDSREYRQTGVTEVAGAGFTGFSLENANGNVTLAGGDEPQIAITATRQLRARAATPESDARQCLERMAIKLARRGDALRVQGETPKAPEGVDNMTINYEIRVPRAMHAELKIKNGNTEIEEIGGAVRTRAENGNLTAHKLDSSLSVHGGNGNVAANEVAGPAEVAITNGNIDCRVIGGALDARTKNGNIEAVEVHGKTALTNDNGSLSGRDLDGDIELRGQTGNTEVAQSRVFADTRRIVMEKKIGQVTLSLPGDQAFTLDADCRIGSITSDFPVRIEGRAPAAHARGTIGTGGPKIELKTSTGRIEIRKR